MYLRRLVSPQLWRRACSTVAAPGGAETSAAAAPMAAKSKAKAKAPAGVEISFAATEKAKAKAQRGKGKILEKLRHLTVETVDLILREEEKKGISVTQEDLLKWVKRLTNEDNRHRTALMIFRWLERNKMTFSPSDLALYVEIIAEVEGLSAAREFFHKVDPEFDNMDPNSKNWPAFNVLSNFMNDD